MACGVPGTARAVPWMECAVLRVPRSRGQAHGFDVVDVQGRKSGCGVRWGHGTQW